MRLIRSVFLFIKNVFLVVTKSHHIKKAPNSIKIDWNLVLVNFGFNFKINLNFNLKINYKGFVKDESKVEVENFILP